MESRPSGLAEASARAAIPKTRSRRCGAPKAAAGRQSHAPTYPSEARSPTTSPQAPPPLTARRFATFSSRMSRGRSSRAIRAISRHRAVSGWSMPVRPPAVLAPRQGNPPTRRSTPGAAPSTARTSSKTGTPGQRFSRVPRRQGSASQNQACSIPARWRPKSSWPCPEKREPAMRGGPPFKLPPLPVGLRGGTSCGRVLGRPRPAPLTPLR